MKVVVLAGGEGTRLAPYTRVLPKPLLPIGSRPILEIIVEQVRDAGMSEVIIATGYLSGLVEAFFGDGSRHGIPISYFREDTPLGTVGALASIDGLDETFILMNGDVLTTPVYSELLDAHEGSGAIATIATRPEPVELDYGVVTLGTSPGDFRRIVAIDEKPCHVVEISAGIYAFEPRVIDYIEPGIRLDFPELITRLLDGGETVASYEHRGYWMDVGQVHHLEAAVQAVDERAEEFVMQDRELVAAANGNGGSRARVHHNGAHRIWRKPAR